MDGMADLSTTTIATAVIAGLAVLFLVWKLSGGSEKTKVTAKSTGAKSKKSKKKSKATTNTNRSLAIEETPAAASVVVSETTTTTSNKKKKKKKSKAAAAPETKKEEPAPPVQQEEPSVQPSPPEQPASTTTAKGKKNKKKKNKAKATNGTAKKQTETSAPAPVPVEDSDDEEDDEAALLTFAKAPSTKKKASSSNSSGNNGKDEGWSTIPNKKKSRAAAAATAAAAENGEGGGSVSLNITSQDIPVLLGPKGSTIQELQATTGAKLDILGKALANPVVKITGSEEEVAAAVEEVQGLIATAQAKVAHNVTLSGAAIQGSEGVKAIVGRGGGTIQNIQAVSGCQIKATIDAGTVVITGPSAEAVQIAERMCKNAVFGESSTTIDFVSRTLLVAVCGRNFQMLRQLQEESGGARLDVEKGSTLLKISGDTAPVAKAKELVQQRMQLCQGTTILFDGSNTGAIFGQGGANLRRIQDTTGAVIDIIDRPDQSECRIMGEPDAVKAAETMIHKSLSGEVELKPGEVREVVELGVGAAAVIGRGGSKIAELERTHNVKLNVQSGSGECSIVGKKAAVASAKTEIEGIVEPLKAKAIEEARIQEEAEKLTASGDGTWGGGGMDDADGW